MTVGTLAPYPIFRADDADGNPLEGGKIHSFLSGTSTPLALYADAALTTPLANPLILDASGEAQFYYGPSMYGLTLTDAQDVPLWTIDPVNAGGGGAAAAGIGMGQNTVEMQPLAGSAQAQAAVFPQDVLALGLTVRVQESFGTSQGLTQMGLGTTERPDCWGVLPPLAAAATSSAGQFLTYSGQPMPQSGVVTLTAYGGRFDGVGRLYLTGHFLTLSPSTSLGLSYTPPGPTEGQVIAPQPPASETQVGGTRYGTDAETLTGTLRTVATHPAGVKAALDARVPPATALSVPRYTVTGTTLESSPLAIEATPLAVLTNCDLVVRRTSGVSSLAVEGPAGSQRILAWRTGTLSRWMILATTGAETGSNVGSDLQIVRRDDAGVSLGAMLHLQRTSGNLGLATTLNASLGAGAAYQLLNVKGSTLYVGQSSTQERPMGALSTSWVVSTDATRTARLALSAYDSVAGREGVRLEADGTAARLGFFGGAAVAKPTVTGSRGANAALASALTALSSLGLLTDSSTA